MRCRSFLRAGQRLLAVCVGAMAPVLAQRKDEPLAEGTKNRGASRKAMRERIDGVVGLMPREPCVYIMKGEDGQIIYIGKAKVLRGRVQQYFRAPGQ